MKKNFPTKSICLNNFKDAFSSIKAKNSILINNKNHSFAHDTDKGNKNFAFAIKNYNDNHNNFCNFKNALGKKPFNHMQKNNLKSTKDFIYSTTKKNFSVIKIKSMTEETSIPLKSYEIEKIRNIGIIAHIDAGKTTTSERMLYYSGVIAKPGEVHHGNTVMDYMQQERERGITIRAAAVSFDWKGHQINLIDTPGHIDFTAEVERSLRVLDGAVVILDGSMGVETQTITVWKQANKYNLPRIAFINKLDKAGANVENTLLAIHRRLGVKPILINYPIGEESNFTGLVDLILLKKINYIESDGFDFDYEELDQKTDKNYSKYLKLRETMIEELAIHDEKLMSMYLEGENIETEYLINLIRKLVIENKITIVLCGSSLKNKGVQQILDSIAAFFPSPLDTKPVKAARVKNSIVPGKSRKNEVIMKHPSNFKGSVCGIIFKIINDKEKGCLAFFKLYEGVLKNKAQIKYTNKTPIAKERIIQLLRVKADECMQLSDISAGDIGAIIGLKEAKSGDTFIDENDNELCVLPGVYNPEPVFFCAIYPNRNSDFKTLMNILENLNREDPSIQVKFDKETNQTLLCGLGELHLEIIRDRIELEYGICAKLGKMKVSFRESVRKCHRYKFKLDKEFNRQNLFFEMELEIFPIEFDFVKQIQNNSDFDITKLFEEDTNSIAPDSSNDMNVASQKAFRLFDIERYKKNNFNPVEADGEDPLKLLINGLNYHIFFDFEELEPFVETVKLDNKDEEVFKSLNLLNPDHKRYLFECILESLNCGSLLGYQNVNIGVRILNGKYSNQRTSELAVKICTAEAMKTILKECDPIFMEPFMLVEIIAPNNCTSDIISDITGKRRGKIISIICDNQVKDNSSSSNGSNTNKENNNHNNNQDFPYKFLFNENKSEINKISNEEILTRIYALAPLSQLVGYAAHVRSTTKGEGKFFMKFHQFDQVDAVMQEKVLNGSYFYE